SDEEIDRYMQDTGAKAPDPEGLEAMDARVASAARALARDAAAAREEGVFLPLDHLREVFSLSPGETSILVACLAPDLDLRFERYYAYLQNDVARKRPCVQLLGRLFLEDAADYAALRHLFASSDSLVGQRLLEPAAGSAEGGFAAFQPRVPENLLDFLLGVGGSGPDPRSPGIWREGRPLASATPYYGPHQSLAGDL